jgi:hypothetical protein
MNETTSERNERGAPIEDWEIEAALLAAEMEFGN